MKVVVVGAGAAGMMAAIQAAQNKNEVIIIEHMDRPGKKIKVTGNGKCNLSNYAMDEWKFSNPEFVKEVFEIFSLDDTISFLNEAGLMLRERNGYIYPMSEQAANVVNTLVNRINLLGIKVIYNCDVREIEKNDRGFIVKADKSFICDKVIIACGGKSAAKTGSDGSGYKLAINLGHRVNKPLPGLCGMICKDDIFSKIQGVRAKAKLILYIEGNLTYEESGELQMTDYGVSGIPAFNASRIATLALHKKEDVYIKIDFLPELKKTDVEEFIVTQLKKGNSLINTLKGMLNDKIANAFYEQVNEISTDETTKIKNVISMIKEYQIKVVKVKSFDQAQVTCGGVNVSEINPKTMESYIVNGLYFAGEILDVDGMCGGYNLQFAWSTGAIAGKSC